MGDSGVGETLSLGRQGLEWTFSGQWGGRGWLVSFLLFPKNDTGFLKVVQRLLKFIRLG